MGEKRRSVQSGKTLSAWFSDKIRGRPDKRAGFVVILQAISITFGIAWLCYDDIRGAAWFPVVWIMWRRYCGRRQTRETVQKKEKELKELLLMVSSSMQAGYSVENAFLEGERELQDMFGKQSVLLPGLHEMNAGAGVSIPLEQAFAQFAVKIGLEDAVNFAQIFSFAKRAGGDYGKNIRKTALKLEEKIETSQEIETILTEKRLELTIMSWMPPGIILYVRLTSGEFMALLYHNMPGVLIMTGCIFVYGFLLLVGERIVKIKV